MEYFASVRKENIKHQWRQEKYPPQLRHEPWLARGDTKLPPSERPKIYDTHTGQARDMGNKVQRPDTVCRSNFATRRASGRLAEASEPLSKQLDVRRHAWLKQDHQTQHRFHKDQSPHLDDSVATDIRVKVRLLDIPDKALQHIASFFDIHLFGIVEITCRSWNPILHSSAIRSLNRIPQRAIKVLHLKCRGKFQHGNNRKLALVDRYESVARAYRFAVLCERRLDQHHLGHSCLAQGASAKHSLVVTATKLSEDGLPGSRVLQSFGWGNFGQTGLRCFQPQAVPALVEPFATEAPRRICMASAGTTHSLCCDESGVAWSWGEDDSRFGGGQSSGYSDGGSQLCRHADPRPIAALYGVRILSVAAGNRFSVVLSDDGRLWSWGANSWGCLGHGEPRDEPAPRPLENFRTHRKSKDPTSTSYVAPLAENKIVPFFNAISCGPRHCLALDRHGHCWSWGCGTDGVLGLGDEEHADRPTRVNLEPIVAPKHHTSDYQSSIYSTPPGRSQYFPHGSPPSSCSGSISGEFKGGIVRSISAGGRHSLLLTEDGRLLSCGSNSHGQLGRSVVQKQHSSSDLKSTFDQHHSYLASVPPTSQSFKHKNNQHYSQHQHYGTITRLHQGSDRKRHIDGLFHPIEIDEVSSLASSLQANLRFTQSFKSGNSCEPDKASHWIACSAGGYHSLAVRRDGSAWSWGSDEFGQLGRGDASPPPSGFDAKAQLGLAKPIRAPFGASEKRPNQYKASPIPALRGQVIETVAAGDGHSLFKTRNHSQNRLHRVSFENRTTNQGKSYNDTGDEDPIVVLACGDGSQGQLGTLHPFLSSGDIADHAVPTYVDLVRERFERQPYSHSMSQQYLSSLQIGNHATAQDNVKLRYRH